MKELTTIDHWPEAEVYKQRKVLITGGLGFLGLNLVIKLLTAGADVRVLDTRLPSDDGKIKPLLEKVHLYIGDLRDQCLVVEALRDCEIAFNLAGRSGAAVSNDTPLDDMEVNVRGQLTFLEACRRTNPQVKVIFPSSRLVYQPTNELPVAETAKLEPLSIYGLHKLIGENYHLLYSRLYGLHTTILRLTNPYGPFQKSEQSRYGIINWFIHLAVHGQTLPVYGDGYQLRDYVHVDDVTRALLLSGVSPQADGHIFNVGGGQPISFKHMTDLIIQIAQGGKVEFLDWPTNAAQVETGSFVADISLIDQVIGWQPRIPFHIGLAEVIQIYKNSRI